MKIAFLLHAPFGRQGSSASFYLPEVLARSEDVLVITPPYSGSSESYRVASARAARIHWLGTARPIAAALEAARVLRRFGPELVHAMYNPKSALLYAACRAALRGQKTAWLLDVRAPLLTTGMKRLASQALGFSVQPLFDFAFSTAYSSLATAIPFSRLPQALLPVGIDLGHFPVAPPGPHPLPLTRFVYAGSLARSRRLDVMLEGFLAFAQKTTRPVSLDIFGGGDDLPRLESLAQSAGQAIRFHGSIPHQDLCQRLSAFDAGLSYVPGGPYDDSPSLKILEYAAAGLPILASNTRAHQRFAEEGFALCLFENTPGSLAVEAENMASRGVAGQALSRNRELAAAYDWTALVTNVALPRYRQLAARAAQG